MGVDVVIPAAGFGRRFGSDIPKQYMLLAGKPIITHVIDFFTSLDVVDRVTVAVQPGDALWQRLGVFEHAKVRVIEGGDERFQSVLLALNSLSDFCEKDDWIMVHDAVRPCLTKSEFDALLSACWDTKIGGLLGVPAVDTLKLVKGDIVESTFPRDSLWMAQTPQMFRYAVLTEALETALGQDNSVTDESSAVEGLGFHPIMVKGKSTNIKITRPEDLELAALFLVNPDEA